MVAWQRLGQSCIWIVYLRRVTEVMISYTSGGHIAATEMTGAGDLVWSPSCASDSVYLWVNQSPSLGLSFSLCKMRHWQRPMSPFAVDVLGGSVSVSSLTLAGAMTLLPHLVSCRGSLGGQGSRWALCRSDPKWKIPASSEFQDVPSRHIHPIPPRGPLRHLSQDTVWVLGRIPPSLGHQQRQSGPIGVW